MLQNQRRRIRMEKMENGIDRNTSIQNETCNNLLDYRQRRKGRPCVTHNTYWAPRQHDTIIDSNLQRSRHYSISLLIPSFVLLVIVNQISIFVVADWIDPETPYNVRTTTPLPARQYVPPKPKPTVIAAEVPSKSTTVIESFKTTTIVQGNISIEVSSPTAHPTTGTPTEIPTASPSESPTVHVTPKVFELVFSDEFNLPGREFQDGADPRWTALDKNDYTNDALHYYSPDNVRIDDGHLVISTIAADTDIVGFDDVKQKRTRVTKHFRSAMLQTWNKFCFTGGIIEAQVVLPGKSNVGGLWPAFWLLGNLARHTYVGSSEHIWPWSSQICTPKSKTAQKISGCNSVAHYGMAPRLGRGAPEIDIFEVQPGNIKGNNGVFLKSAVGQPFMSASFQVAPGRSANRPGPGEWPGPDQWYSGTGFGVNTSLNILFYGAYNHFNDDTNPLAQDYWSDAISYNRQLDESYFTKPHVYRLEWEVPVDNFTDGYLHWFVDGELVSMINGTGIKMAGLGSEISSEPSYVLLNTAVSKQWGFPHECPNNCPCKEYDCKSKDWADTCGFSEGFCDMMTSPTKPVEYKIDWVRLYQDPTNPAQKVGCSTPERPTRRYIIANEKHYKTESDEHPLKGIPRGLGVCDPKAVAPEQYAPFVMNAKNISNSSATAVEALSNIPTVDIDNEELQQVLRQTCGGRDRGKCTFGNVCECYAGWTGPHCLSYDGYDPIPYDLAEKITDVGFVAPIIVPNFLVIVFGGLLILLALVIINQNRLSAWEPVPDVDIKKTYVDNNHHDSQASLLSATSRSSKRRLSV